MRVKKTTVEKRRERNRRRPKPECCAVRIGGRLRMVGAKAAADWLGISHTSLNQIVNGSTTHAKDTVAFVRREYPGLFLAKGGAR